MSKETKQLAALNHLLRVLRDANPFYKKRLEAAGINQDVETIQEYVESVPFTTKQELVDDQLANPPYGTNKTYPISMYTRFSQTSATSGGLPVVWLDTSDSWQWMVGNWEKVYTECGVGQEDRIFCAFSFGPFLGFWTAYEAAQKLDALVIPGGAMDTVTRLEMMRKHAVTVLCCTPTYALRLFEVAQERGMRMQEFSLQKVLVAGEPGGSLPAFQKRFAQIAPKVELIDHYGMTEVGPVAVRDQQNPDRMHLFDDRYLAEVIDPKTCKPIEDGESREGELVLTPLGRLAAPVLRYRTGDLVRVKQVDDRTLLEGGIMGRIDDMVVIRGVNVFPSAVDAVVREFSEVIEYRVEVDKTRSLPELFVEIELEEGDKKGVVKKLQERFQQAFALRVEVKIVETGALPRFEMKAKRWFIKRS